MTVMMRAAGFALALAFAIALGAPLQWLLRRTGRQQGADRLQMAVSRLLCATLGLRVHIKGQRPASKPCLVVANHVSWTDILVLGATTPLCFLAKADVAGWPLLGPAVRAHGTLFVSRRRTRSMGEANGRIADALAQGRTVVLFAEGTTGNGTRLEAFRSGHLDAANLLLRDHPSLPEVVLVPAAIAYPFRGGLPAGTAGRAALAWFGDTALLPHILELLRHGPIRCDLVWGEPLSFRRDDDRRLCMAELRRRVHRDFTSLIAGACQDPVNRRSSGVCSAQSMSAPSLNLPSGSPS